MGVVLNFYGIFFYYGYGWRIMILVVFYFFKLIILFINQSLLILDFGQSLLILRYLFVFSLLNFDVCDKNMSLKFVFY